MFSNYVYFPLNIQINDNYMVTGCKGFNSVGCEVKIWDVRSNVKPVFTLLGHSQDVTDTMLIKKNDRVLSVSKDGSIGLWSVLTGDKISWKHRNEQVYTCIASGATTTNTTTLTTTHGSDESTNHIETVSIGSFDGSIHRFSLGSSSASKGETECDSTITLISSTNPSHESIQ